MYRSLSWNYETHPARWIDQWPDDARFFPDWETTYSPLAPFESGIRIPAGLVPTPVVAALQPFLDSGEDSPTIPDVLITSGGLLLSERLHRTLVAFGVDNLDAYPAELFDPDDEQNIPGYVAVNVIGLIAAADMQKSIATVHPGGAVIDVSFDQLVIDEAKARGALMFRLAENPYAVWCHPALVAHIEKAGFPGVGFSSPAQTVLL